jgi:putative transposase
MMFLRTAEDERFEVLAYCFMPDHLHLLVEGASNTSDLQTFVKAARQYSGRAHANVHGAALWQEGYHERVLRHDQDARTVARYILENPVRAGIVRAATEYPYMGSAVWSVSDLLRSTSR